jgi:hypothetical protein
MFKYYPINITVRIDCLAFDVLIEMIQKRGSLLQNNNIFGRCIYDYCLSKVFNAYITNNHIISQYSPSYVYVDQILQESIDSCRFL